MDHRGQSDDRRETAVGTTESRPDVVIVGGVFAGVTAARELTMRGRSAVLVEARDRLGGRTYTSDHDGHAMELGGTWVHPLQPNAGPRSDQPLRGGNRNLLGAMGSPARAGATLTTRF
jgi:choline dehydrogenase-like flavoprotein